MGLAPPVLGQLFGGSSGNLGDLEATVAVVTEANYEEALRQSRSRPWILEFYAPWCKHCQAYAPVYKEAAEKVPALRFAKVDATAETAIRDANGVSGYPTLKLLIDGYVRDYKGARGPEGFEYLSAPSRGG
jgi:thiol-disulfide isomerase/thioredoxin